MIPHSHLFDQPTLCSLIKHDAVVQRYRAFFDLINWTPVEQYQELRSSQGRPAHPESAYVKALLVKLCEGKVHITELRLFLIEHPLLVLELGFRPVLDPAEPFGFAVEKTVPKVRWLRE